MARDVYKRQVVGIAETGSVGRGPRSGARVAADIQQAATLALFGGAIAHGSSQRAERPTLKAVQPTERPLLVSSRQHLEAVAVLRIEQALSLIHI